MKYKIEVQLINPSALERANGWTVEAEAANVCRVVNEALLDEYGRPVIVTVEGCDGA